MARIFCHWSINDGDVQRAFRADIQAAIMVAGTVEGLVQAIRSNSTFDTSLRLAGAPKSILPSSCAIDVLWAHDDVPVSRPAATDEPVATHLADGDDVFLRLSAPLEASKVSEPQPSGSSALPTTAAQSAKAASSSASHASQLSKARMYASARKLRMADDIWATILKEDGDCGEALIGRAMVHLLCDRPRKATSLLQRAIEKTVTGRTTRALMLLGEALRRVGRFDEAISTFDRAGSTVPLPAKPGRTKEEAADASGGIVSQTRFTRLDALAAVAQAMLDQANDAGAVKVLNSVLSLGEGHTGVLLQYARVTGMQGDLGSAVGIAMRAVVSDQGSREAKLALSDLVAMRGGVEAILRLLPGRDAGASSALGFLATAVRDGGAVMAAVQLLAHAAERSPGAATYWLNLAHCLENLGMYQLAFEYCREFCRRNAATVVRRERADGTRGDKVEEVSGEGDLGTADPSDMSAGFALGDVVEALSGLADVHCFAREAGLPVPAPEADPRGKRSPQAAPGAPPSPGALPSAELLCRWLSGLAAEAAESDHRRATALARGADGRPSHPGKALAAQAPAVLTRDKSSTVAGRAAAEVMSLGPPCDAQVARAAAHAAAVRGTAGVWHCDWVPGAEPHALVVRAADAAAAASGTAVTGAPPGASAAEATSGVWQLAGGSDALDTMALVMTLCKVLHTAGALPVLPRVVRVVERARRGTMLHKTLIRNEAAYYCCVAQCLGALQRGRAERLGSLSKEAACAFECDVEPLGPGLTLAGPLTAGGAAASTGSEDKGCVFVLGDSHTVAPAWQAVSLPRSFVQGAGADDSPVATRLRPALVTGIKAWHLRPASRFYPRVHWESVAGALPRGARVITCVGEIDCREGILVAVERRRYKDVPAGIKKVVGILVESLRKQAVEQDWRILVQPAAPVLDATRPVVLAFNDKLREEVVALGKELVEDGAAGSVGWLEYAQEMLKAGASSPAGQGFREDEYGLDGTHLHPRYLRLLERAALDPLGV